ncbi:transient receptor potential cation channel subfamily V member 1-like isoform X2 [Neoarius graeffei]|uniref:transient receptor potential cation channel subfamily V member 1-like isoform X2 n=1 Tax=Neoarius graeffei TaxID=443677 RepID=UPI00298CBD76|nr:transient receptor potential cation channel subfamily V member 1-like isoform X2 [Neoarius graeffei]
MASIPLEFVDKIDEEREKDKEIKKRDRAIGQVPMDTDHEEDFGTTPCQIQINESFSDKIQGIEPNPDQHKRFDVKMLFEAVSSGDISRLEGLEEYLTENRRKLTNIVCEFTGKTVLMKALLNLKNEDSKIVELLLGIAERNNELDDLVNAEFTDIYYKGQTALHIAIERRKKRSVELLIQKGANVEAKASGKFFQPLSDTCFYFGELPLSLAACTNQKDIVDLLMDKADVRRTDTLGNTVLHALVMVADNSPENTDFVNFMYDYILTKDAAQNPNKNKLEDIENNQGLTSIKLAAKLGKIGLLQHILNRNFQKKECRHLSRMFTEWAYGPVCSSLYDLDSIDTYEPKSVLEIVVYGPEIPNRLEMLQIEPLNKLLEDKWNRFAKWIFLVKFIVYFIYVIIFTVVSYHREEGNLPFLIGKSCCGYQLLGQLIMAIGALYILVTVLMDLYKKQPSLQTMLVDCYSDLLFLLQAVLFMICAGLYFKGMQAYLAFLVLSLVLCWVNLLSFSRGTRHMGIYRIMIQRIFLHDILHFLFVYTVFIIGFSAALVTLLKNSNPKTNRSFFLSDDNSISFTIMELFKITIGMGGPEFIESDEYKEVFYVLLISYIVLTYILLLNMLIALMSKTVDNTYEKSASIWKLQRAITTLDLERFACCLKMNLRSGVRKNLGKKKEDWRWCLRVEEVNWKKWNRNLGSIREDPGEFKKVSYREPSKNNGFQWRSKRNKVQAGQETQPLASSPV